MRSWVLGLALLMACGKKGPGGGEDLSGEAAAGAELAKKTRASIVTVRDAFRAADKPGQPMLDALGKVEVDAPPARAFGRVLSQLPAEEAALVMEFAVRAELFGKQLRDLVSAWKRDQKAFDRPATAAQFAVHLRTSEQEETDPMAGGAEVVELGSALCTDDAKPTPATDCTATPWGFLWRTDPEAPWRKGQMTTDPRVEDRLVPLVPTAVAPLGAADSPNVTEVMHRRRLAELFRDADALVELSTRVEESLRRLAAR
jgi:hypothetical protein